MGRPKKAAAAVELPNRLASGQSDGKAIQGRFADPENPGKTIEEGVKIADLEQAAENFRAMKKRIADLKEKLDGELYGRLKDAYLLHKPELPNGIYRYYDAGDELHEVAMDTEPKVSVRKVKKAKKEEDGRGINPGGGDVGALDDDGVPVDAD